MIKYCPTKCIKFHECIGFFFNHYLRSIQQTTEKKYNLFDGIMDTIFWIRPYMNFDMKLLSEIPGLQLDNCNDQLCLQYTLKPYDKTVILNFF